MIILANLQGCAVKCFRPIPIGTTVQIDGLPTQSLIIARVVNCIDIHSEPVWLLGLALDEPGNVWSIASPPSDWIESDSPDFLSLQPGIQEKQSNSRKASSGKAEDEYL